MTWAGDGGAQPPGADPFETLAPFAEAATVRIHEAPRGYAEGEPVSRPWGSGFFIAPGWVLTCAHVALRGEAGEGGKREVGLSFGNVGRPVGGLVEWALPDDNPGGGLWPAPDLALIRLLEPVPHECVWLSERTAKVFTAGRVAFFGWAETDDGTVGRVSGRCSIGGQFGDGLLKLGPEDEFPEGVSGGPVVDLERGEVIGVLKARRPGRDGGLAVSVVQLRRLPGPAGPVLDEYDDLYHRVLHAHDRHHADRHRDDHSLDPTWTDAQGELRATAGRALTPGQRTELLGLLAELPPPVSTRRLDELVTALRGRPYEQNLPAPRGWRDGLGLLYEARPGVSELESVLRYAVHAATADRPYPPLPGAEDELLAWVSRVAAAAHLPRWFRATLRQEQNARLRDRGPAYGIPGPRLPAEPPVGVLPGPDPGWDGLPGDWCAPAHGAAAPAAPAAEDTAGPEPFVLLEITPHGWERDRYDWRVCAARSTGELTSVDEDFRAAGPERPPARLLAALAEAFRRGDEPGRPVRLVAALPYTLLDLPVESWRPVAGGPTLGEQRPVVLSCADLVGEDGDEAWDLRLSRWDQVHAGGARPRVLDCADGTARSLPEHATLQDLPLDTVPVLCRTPSSGGEPTARHQLLAGGFNVFLWRRDRPNRPPDCDEHHRGAARTVVLADRAGRLPAEVWRLRARAGEGSPEAAWADDLALMYADPRQPYAGGDDPLETL